VFARALVVLVSWAFTGCRYSILDSDEIFVLTRVGVTAVANGDATWRQGKFEGFVLGALCDSGRKLQLLQWMHGSQEHPNASAPPLGARINERAARLSDLVGCNPRPPTDRTRFGSRFDYFPTVATLVDALAARPEF